MTKHRLSELEDYSSFEEWKCKASGKEWHEENFDHIDSRLFLMTTPQISHDFQKMVVELDRILKELISGEKRG